MQCWVCEWSLALLCQSLICSVMVTFHGNAAWQFSNIDKNTKTSVQRHKARRVGKNQKISLQNRSRFHNFGLYFVALSTSCVQVTVLHHLLYCYKPTGYWGLEVFVFELCINICTNHDSKNSFLSIPSLFQLPQLRRVSQRSMRSESPNFYVNVCRLLPRASLYL